MSKSAILISTEPVLRGGLRGIVYSHGESLSKDHRIMILSDFPDSYVAHYKYDNLFDLAKKAAHMTHVDTLIVHVAPGPHSNVVRDIAKGRRSQRIVWLISGSLQDNLHQIVSMGLAGTKILTCAPQFAATALGLMAASWPELGKVILPDKVALIYPRPVVSESSPDVRLSLR